MYSVYFKANVEKLLFSWTTTLGRWSQPTPLTPAPTPVSSWQRRYVLNLDEKCKMFCSKFHWVAVRLILFLSVCRSRGSFVEAFLCRQRGAKLLSRGGGGGGGGGRGQAVGQLDSVQGGRRLEVPDPHITWRGARGLAGSVASLLILNFYPLFTRVTVMPCLTRMGCPKTLSDDLNANGTHCKSNGLSSWTLPYSHCYQKLSTNYWYGNTL